VAREPRSTPVSFGLLDCLSRSISIAVLQLTNMLLILITNFSRILNYIILDSRGSIEPGEASDVIGTVPGQDFDTFAMHISKRHKK
jgi:hypothetical protein